MANVPEHDPAGRQALGKHGEDLAVAQLTSAGLDVLARNWRCREGELDIVAREGEALVICEVKTRRAVGFGTPLDAVTPAKAARLRRLAVRWLVEQRSASGDGLAGYAEVRFDVVSVLCPPHGPAVVEHLRGVF